MSIERAKKRLQLAGDSVAAIGLVQIEPTQGTEDHLEAIVGILGLQTRALHSLCLCMRDVFIALDNRDPDAGYDEVDADPCSYQRPPGDPAGKGEQEERNLTMSILTRLIKIGVSLYDAFKVKPKFTDILMKVIGFIPGLIAQVGKIDELSNEQKIEEALQAFDDYTGSDVGALDIIKDMPADKEEEVFDAVKVIIRNTAFCKLRVAGYYVDPGAGTGTDGQKASDGIDK